MRANALLHVAERRVECRELALAAPGLNPSLEHFARVFYEDLHARLAFQELSLAVKLWENDRDWAAYGPE